MKQIISFLLFFVFSTVGYSQCLTLDEVWKLVLQNSEDIKRLGIENYQASLNIGQTLSKLLPCIGASASVTFSNPSKAVDGSRIVPSALRAGSLSVNQSLVDLRVRPAYKSAKWAKQATCHQSEFELYEILYFASEAYLAVLQSQELLKVSENQIELAEQQYFVAKEKYDAGEVAVTDVLRTEEEVNRAKRIYHDVFSDVQIYLENLSNFTGTNVCCAALSPPLFLEIEPIADLCFLIEQAYAQREDLKSVAAAIESAKCLVSTLERTNWPKVDLMGEYILASPETLSLRNNSWSATVLLSLPLFDGGINRLNVKNAKAELAKQELLYCRLTKDVKVQVKTAYYALESARANFVLLKNELDISEENYAILSERYQKGQTTNVALMDALTAYIQAQANFANAQYNLILLALKLKKETGMFDTVVSNFRL